MFKKTSFSASAQALTKVQEWFILLDYDENQTTLDFTDIHNFDMAVLDPDHHPPLEGFGDHMTLIAYISVGEAENYRFYWKDIKDKAWVIGENKNWQGNYYVDVRHESWKSIIINKVIPRIIDKGFTGLMLDTLDTAEYLQSIDSDSYAGSLEGMIDLVKSIKENYPNLYLISNNGFSILDDISSFLSGVLVEDIFMMVDFKNDTYIKVPEDERQYKIMTLEDVQNKYSLTVFNIEYVSQKEPDLIQKYRQLSQELGFKPYIAEKNLSELYQQY